MGTRSHIGFRKGNEVRYIYVSHDGYDHGKTLKAIGREECEKIWDAIGEADSKGQRVWLDHLYTDEMFEKCYSKETQPTARTPMVAEEPNWSKKYLDDRGYTVSGVIKVEGSCRISPVDILEMYNDEGTAWMYDFDRDTVIFAGNPDYTKLENMDFGSEIREKFSRERIYAAF